MGPPDRPKWPLLTSPPTGEVTRSDVANFLILERGKIVGEGDIKVLRSLHFDERKMLYALLHQSGRSGELPEEVRRALRSINGVNEQAKKRPSKTHKEAPQEQFPEASEVK